MLQSASGRKLAGFVESENSVVTSLICKIDTDADSDSVDSVGITPRFFITSKFYASWGPILWYIF